MCRVPPPVGSSPGWIWNNSCPDLRKGWFMNPKAPKMSKNMNELIISKFPRHHVGEHVRHAYSNTFNLKALEYACRTVRNMRGLQCIGAPKFNFQDSGKE